LGNNIEGKKLKGGLKKATL